MVYVGTAALGCPPSTARPGFSRSGLGPGVPGPRPDREADFEAIKKSALSSRQAAKEYSPVAQAVGGKREMRTPRRDGRPAVPHTVRIQTPCGARQARDFHKRDVEYFLDVHIDTCQRRERNSASDAGFARSELRGCTKYGHRPVDDLHSTEKTCTYKRVFFVDGIYRRSTTGSFFDSFLSFTGWCGVRGSSGITFLIARLGRRVSEGL